LAVEDEFEILTPTEVDSATVDEKVEDLPSPVKIRKLCACGCGEEVTGNRALKRGHVMGDGLSASIFSGNDILVFQAAFVALVGAITSGIENKTGVPKTEPEESQAIGQPLGRIAARHIPKALLRKMKPGDAADCVLIGTTMTAYIVRITTSPRPMKKEEIPVAANGHVNNSGVSRQTVPLNQYAYQPPEQNFKPQDGNAY
jgi:hypothetical protein